MADNVVAEDDVVHCATRTGSILVLGIEEDGSAFLPHLPVVFEDVSLNEFANSGLTLKQILDQKESSEVGTVGLPPDQQLEQVIATYFNVTNIGLRSTAAPKNILAGGLDKIVDDFDRPRPREG